MLFLLYLLAFIGFLNCMALIFIANGLVEIASALRNQVAEALKRKNLSGPLCRYR